MEERKKEEGSKQARKEGRKEPIAKGSVLLKIPPIIAK